jgi:hypothetical protein
MSKEIRQMIDKVKNFNQFINEDKSDIDDKLSIINNKRKRRSGKFVYTKEQIISDIREVVQIVGGKITWSNPNVIWTMDEFIDSKGNSIKWEDMSEKTLERFISDMNTIFIYGYGSNQVI